jgi:CheY-like chemotaxis protein
LHSVKAQDKPKVLVIDDDNLVADTLTMILNGSGYDAVAAYSGEDGLELARQAAYDHLVTDVMMEPMNGIQAAIAMRAICPDCTVLLMSGNERTSALLAEAVQDGYTFDILAKPVHPTVILDRLRNGEATAHGPKSH